MIRFENEESHIRMMVKGRFFHRDMHLRKNKEKELPLTAADPQGKRAARCVVNLVFFSPRI